MQTPVFSDKKRLAIMNKPKLNIILLPLLIVISFLPNFAQANRDNVTVVALTRHTFRGVTKEIAPQKIQLKSLNIEVDVPLLSYSEDATPRGLDIAKDFASRGLQTAASMAVDALQEQSEFDGRWDEIRSDLATQRTFWTALKIRDGLAHDTSMPTQIPVTGCKTKPQAAVDILSAKQPVFSCVPSAVRNAIPIPSQDRALVARLSDIFLTEIGTAIGAMQPVSPQTDVTASIDESAPNDDTDVTTLASSIEMIASLSAPLPRLFKHADHGQLLRNGKAVLTAGLNVLGARFFLKDPLPLSDNIVMPALNAMMARPQGSHTAIVTHDDYLSAMLHSLGFITSDSDPNQLAIYPLETIVFALGQNNVSVTRMRLVVREDGYIPGMFETMLVWKGTRDAWNQRVQRVYQRAKAWDVSGDVRACLDALKVCDAQTIDVAY